MCARALWSMKVRCVSRSWETSKTQSQETTSLSGVAPSLQLYPYLHCAGPVIRLFHMCSHILVALGRREGWLPKRRRQLSLVGSTLRSKSCSVVACASPAGLFNRAREYAPPCAIVISSVYTYFFFLQVKGWIAEATTANQWSWVVELCTCSSFYIRSFCASSSEPCKRWCVQLVGHTTQIAQALKGTTRVSSGQRRTWLSPQRTPFAGTSLGAPRLDCRDG